MAETQQRCTISMEKVSKNFHPSHHPTFDYINLYEEK